MARTRNEVGIITGLRFFKKRHLPRNDQSEGNPFHTNLKSRG